MNPMIIAALVNTATSFIGNKIQKDQATTAKADLEAAEAALPEYKIPDEISENLTQAQQQSLQGMPADQQKMYIENIWRATQQGFGALNQRGLGVAGTSALFRNQQDAYRDLLGADYMARKENLGNLATARGTMAQYKDMKFNIDQQVPMAKFQQASNQLAANQGAFNQSQFDLLGSLGQSTGAAFGAYGNPNPYGYGSTNNFTPNPDIMNNNLTIR